MKRTLTVAEFVLEWDDGQDATEAYARRLRAIGHNATYCLSDCVDRTDSYLVEFDKLALVPLAEQVRESRDIAPRWNRWPVEQGDYIS